MRGWAATHRVRNRPRGETHEARTRRSKPRAGRRGSGGLWGRRGGGGGAADAPSTDEFCGALKNFQDDFSDADPTKDLPGYIKTLKDAADEFEDVGRPTTCPTTPRRASSITIDTINDLDDDATLDDLAQIGDFSEEEQKKTEAFEEYIAKDCPDLSGETGSSALRSGRSEDHGAAGRSR